MLSEVIENLSIKKNGIYVDCTVGGAGHSTEIAKLLDKDGMLICIDKDIEALNVSNKRLEKFCCKKIFVHDDFKNLKKILSEHGIQKVDGILADLGVSSYQIDEASRGFSYNKDAQLDMRMDKSQVLTAKYIVNNYSESELVKILFEYGEESFAKNIARNIVKNRVISPINTTLELVKIIESSVPSKILHKGGSVAKKTFQALRIETNGELETLKNVLDDMIDTLKTDGKLCIITFHSLEDRMVKNCFSKNSMGCICPKSFPICVCNHKPVIALDHKKPIVPTEEEIKNNPRSSSSKLRVAKKL